MNANFRRDYLYQATTDYMGVKEGTKLRYLRYKKDTKQYQFLTGQFPNKDEELVEVHRNEVYPAMVAFKRVKCNGYDATNDYSTDIGKVITSYDNLEIGRKYKFITKQGGRPYISDKVLQLVKLTRNIFGTKKAVFINDTLTQTCLNTWLNDGLVKAKLVG